MKISCQSCGAKYNIADEKVRGKIVKIACKKCGARIEIDGREQQEQASEQDETRVYDQAQAAAAAAGAIDTWTVSVDDNDQREINTAQLLELYAQGTINADTFVWRDGMADWAAIRDVDALRNQLGAPAAASAPPPANYSQPPTAAYNAPVVPGFNGGGGGGYAEPPPAQMAAAGGYPAPAIDTAQAARLGGSRRGGGADLFGSAPAEDEDVATSAPQPGVALGGGGGMGMGAVEAGDQRPIGARNENSVLFSLAALTASGPATSSAVPTDDEKSGLIDIQKLAAAAKPGGGKDDRAKLDDIMNLGGGGAFGSALGAPILAPPPQAVLEAPQEQSSQRKASPLLWVAILLGVAIVGLLVFILLRKPEETTAKKEDKKEDESKDKDKGSKEPSTKDTATAGPGSSGEAPPDSTGGPIGKPGSKPSGGAPGGTGKPGVVTPGTPGTSTASATASATSTGGGAGKPCKTLEECMGAGKTDPPKKDPDPPKPAGECTEIDKTAAIAALKAVPYKDCGSGGAGKVSVTFGKSGSVAGASVTAGEYDGGTKSCIAGRFRGAKVPAFTCDPKTFGWSISL